MFGRFYLQLFILIAGIFVIQSKYYPAHINLGSLFQSIVTNDIHGSLRSQYLSAISLALNEINSKNYNAVGILSNSTLKLAVRFPTFRLTSIVDSSEYLMTKAFSSDGMNIALGSVSSSNTRVTAKFFEKRNITQLGWDTDSSFSYKKNYPNFYRISHSDAFQGRILAEIIKSELFGWDKVTLFSSSDYFGSSASYEFRTRSNDLGIEILADISFTKGSQNFDAGITRAKDSLASIFVILADTTDSIRLLQQGYTSGLFSEGKQIIGTSYLAVEEEWRQMSSISNVDEIMKGLIVVIPSVDLTSSRINQFMKKWRAQKNTITRLPNGKIICSNKTDDETENATPLFQSYNGSSWECFGLDYQSFPLNGSTINNMTFYIYDAVYSIAYALHELLYVQGLGKEAIHSDKFKQILHNQTFQGLTGNISYFSGLANTESYAAGDRRTGAFYRIRNFQDCSDYSIKFTSNCFKTIGSWHSENGYKSCKDSGFDASECSIQIHYNTIDNSVPIDWPNPIYRTLSSYLFGIIWSCVALCAIVVAVFTVMTIKYRKISTIRAAQPAMLYVILIGSILATCFVAITAQEVTLTTCITGLWLGHLSYGLVFGALYLKTWRVHRLANSGFKKVKISATYLKVVLFVLFLTLVLYLLVMTLVSGIYVHEHSTIIGTTTYIDIQCSRHVQGLAISLYLLEGILLVAGAYLCWLVRNVPDNINESVYIASAIYVIGFVCLLVFPITFVLDEISPISSRFAKVIGFSLCLVSTIISIFGSKAVIIMRLDHALARADAERSKSKEVLHSHSHSRINASQQVNSRQISRDTNTGSKSKLLTTATSTNTSTLLKTEHLDKSIRTCLTLLQEGQEGQEEDQYVDNNQRNSLKSSIIAVGTSNTNNSGVGVLVKSPLKGNTTPLKYSSTIAKNSDEIDDPLVKRTFTRSQSHQNNNNISNEEFGLTETRSILFLRQPSQDSKANNNSNLSIINENEFTISHHKGLTSTPGDNSSISPLRNSVDFETSKGGRVPQRLASLNSSIISTTSEPSEINPMSQSKEFVNEEINDYLEQFSHSGTHKILNRGNSRNSVDSSISTSNHNGFKSPVKQGGRLSANGNKMFNTLDQLSFATEVKGDDSDLEDSEEDEGYEKDDDTEHRVFLPISKGIHLIPNTSSTTSSNTNRKVKASAGDETKSSKEKKKKKHATTSTTYNSLEIYDCDDKDFV